MEHIVMQPIDTDAGGQFQPPMPIFGQSRTPSATDASAQGRGTAVVVLIAPLAVLGIVVVCQAEVHPGIHVLVEPVAYFGLYHKGAVFARTLKVIPRAVIQRQCHAPPVVPLIFGCYIGHYQAPPHEIGLDKDIL